MLCIGDVVSAVPYSVRGTGPYSNRNQKTEVGVIVQIGEHEAGRKVIMQYAVAFPSCSSNSWFVEDQIELIGECPVFRA
jgi:hypothetical protein